ncbi:DUF5817 domain-containing protein [Candidatus Hikarchaeum yamanae]|uniref:DUF5817 domain-containing protein n=1 Tax=Candidatus Hikarchaeum yamanae TaxID=2675326 RepID=UPI0039E75D3F
MYSVVGCDRCQTIWIVGMRPKTVKCPRCSKRHNFRELRKFAEEEDIEVARVVRTQLLSERIGTSENKET